MNPETNTMDRAESTHVSPSGHTFDSSIGVTDPGSSFNPHEKPTNSSGKQRARKSMCSWNEVSGTPAKGHSTKETLEQLSEHFECLLGQVPNFQYELEHFEAYQRVKFHTQNVFTPEGFRRRKEMKSPQNMSKLNHELEIIDQRPNRLEIEMYSDLINKCVTFGDMMMEWMENRWQSMDNESGEMRAGPLRNKDAFSQPMAWTMEKIDLVLERILNIMISNIQKMTGIECELMKNEISQELGPLAKTFLWLVLQDQKRYEKVFPTGMEIKAEDDVKVMSYIDQHPAQCNYCTNIVRCTITEEVEDYLSSDFTHGIGPEMIPEMQRNRASCNQSRPQIYAEALNQIWTFLIEMNLKINTHILKPRSLSPAQTSEDCDGDDVNSSTPDSVFDRSDPESLSPTLSPVDRIKDDILSLISGSLCEGMDLEPLSSTQSTVNRIQYGRLSIIPESISEIPDPESLSPTLSPVDRIEDGILSTIPGSICERRDLEPLSPTRSPVDRIEDDVPSAIPDAVWDEMDSEPLSPNQTPVFRFKNDDSSIPQTQVETAQDATAQEKRKEASLRSFVEALVSRTLRKAKVNLNVIDSKAIIKSLFERIWIQLQHNDFDVNTKTFKELHKTMFQELCKERGSAELVLCAMKLGDPALINCIASSVQNHLMTPPRERSTICRFFSSVGRAISNICRRAGGLVGSAYHIVAFQPDSALAALQRATNTTVTMASMGAIFGMATCLSAQAREAPDDPLNYFIGGCASGIFLGARTHSAMTGTTACLGLGTVAFFTKVGKMEGWKVAGPPKL